MEMLFLTAPPSLLWPDGIRVRSEAVKANTSKKANQGNGEGVCVCERIASFHFLFSHLLILLKSEGDRGQEMSSYIN